MAVVSNARARVGQLVSAYRQTAQHDPRLLVILAGTAVVVFAVVLAAGIAMGSPWIGAVSGVLLAAAVTMSVFGRRASRTALAQIEGRPGAAAAVLQSMRQPWRVQPGVAFNGKQDMVHRAIGRSGVVLVGEGRRSRVAALLAKERRKVQRIAGDTPVHEVRIGDGDGEVELAKLRMHLMRLPRAIKKGQIAELDRRLQSMGGADLPIPKGPMPTRRPKPR